MSNVLIITDEVGQLGSLLEDICHSGKTSIVASQCSTAPRGLDYDLIVLPGEQIHLQEARNNWPSARLVTVSRERLRRGTFWREMTDASTPGLVCNEAPPSSPSGSASKDGTREECCEIHVLTRWADALSPILTSRRDPRTIAHWAQLVAVSPGALRTWCSAAQVGARRSLVFARLLRAVHLSRTARQEPERLLDVVDRRTLLSLVRSAGFVQRKLPCDIRQFITEQNLIRDPSVLEAVQGAIHRRGSVLQP